MRYALILVVIIGGLWLFRDYGETKKWILILGVLAMFFCPNN